MSDIDDFLAELKERLEIDFQLCPDVSDICEKYAATKINLRRAFFVVQKQIRMEMREAIYASGLPYKDWYWFSFDEKGIIESPDGKYLVKKISGKYQITKEENGGSIDGFSLWYRVALFVFGHRIFNRK